MNIWEKSSLTCFQSSRTLVSQNDMWHNEQVRRWRSNAVLTSENLDVEFHSTKRHTDHSYSFFQSRIRFRDSGKYAVSLSSLQRIVLTVLRSAVDPKRLGDENNNSIVALETIELLRNSPYGHRNIYGSRHAVRKYLNVRKIHTPLINKLLNKLGRVNKVLYEVELTEEQTERKEPNPWLLFLQYAKLRT